MAKKRPSRVREIDEAELAEKQREAEAKAEFLKAFGDHVRAVRTKQGLSRDRVCAYAGLSRAAMNRLELGRSDPQAWTLYRIAATLGVSLAKLTGVSGSFGDYGPARRPSKGEPVAAVAAKFQLVYPDKEAAEELSGIVEVGSGAEMTIDIPEGGHRPYRIRGQRNSLGAFAGTQAGTQIRAQWSQLEPGLYVGTWDEPPHMRCLFTIKLEVGSK